MPRPLRDRMNNTELKTVAHFDYVYLGARYVGDGVDRVICVCMY